MSAKQQAATALSAPLGSATGGGVSGALDAFVESLVT